MPKALDLTNKKFGKLTAIKKLPSKKGKTYWLCRCDCGAEKEVQTGHLTHGLIISCGATTCKTQILKEYEKKCLICNKTFITNYNNRLYCYECSPSQNENDTSLYQKTKKRAIKHQLILYKGGKCEKCGYNKCEGALQFHHINPQEKDFTISEININKNNFQMELLYKEVDKCRLLCANCHAEEHFEN